MPGGRESAARIARAAERVRSGGVVAFPTETVYGLGADAMNEAAVRRVFALKGRPPSNPLIVHVDGAAMATRVVRTWTEDAQRLADEFWPGPLTIVLQRAPDVPSVVTSGGGTVGVRCPDHPVAIALIEACDTPLVGPSANVSGSVSPTTADHVREAFGEDDVLTLDGGACRAGIESTVLDLTASPARVLRPGVIGAGQIEQALGRLVIAGPADAGGSDPVRAPGLVGPHYRPRAPVRLFSTERELDAVLSPGPDQAVVLCEPGLPTPRGVIRIEMPPDAPGYAARLYAALREADALGAGLIAVHRPAPDRASPTRDRAIWEAVLERLTRAADPG